MAADEKWYFTKEQLGNTPSRRCGIDADKELSYRQQAANFIQDMGQRLQVSQLCINTAIVYMHRFYVYHSLSHFHRNAIASAALFLAAKVEEQPRKLEHVIKIAHTCLHRDQTPIDTRSEQYMEQAQDLVFNENVLLQTLGFDVAIDHPHTHVVRCCQLVKASKDLAQTSYFMASNSLHLTTMCLQYKPTVVACFCIHLACKWSNWEIPPSNEGKSWFWYVDPTVTAEQLQQLTAEFLHIFDKCPSRLKRKIMSISANQSPSINHPSLPNSPFDAEPRRVQSPAMDGGPTFQSSRPFPPDEQKKPLVSSAGSSNRLPMDYREYRDKKERERLERDKTAAGGPVPNQSAPGGSEIPTKPHHPHSHHAKQQQPSSQSSATSGKHPTVPGSKPMHHNHHSAHRNDGKPGGPPPSQRHSSSASSSTGQSGRPRNPREYGVPAPGTTANPQTMYNHQPKDNLITGSEGMSDIPTNIPGDLGIPGSRDSRDVEKLTNHNRGDVKHEKPGQQMQQRGYDPRGKIPEHRSKDEAKAGYTKYPEQQQQQQRGRKVADSVEQRSEEVRKLIEKPISIAKSSIRPDAHLQREDYLANMLKPSHKPQTTSGQLPAGPAVSSTANQPKNPPEYALQPVLSQRERGLSKSSLQQQQQQQQHQQMKYEKNDVKNGNSQGNSQEDARNRMQSQQQVPSVPSQPVKQHKSLFSPEKVSNPRESHSSRGPRQTRTKSPPMGGNTSSSSVGNTGISSISKSAKMQERVPDPMSGGLDLCSFGRPQGVSMSHGASQMSQHHQESKQSSHSKRHRTSSIGDSAKPIKSEIKTEPEDNRDNNESMRGRVSDLTQPIRENPTSTNGRGSYAMPVTNDLKAPELIKPFDEPMARHTPLTNGLETNITVKHEIKSDYGDDSFRDSQDSGLGCSQTAKPALLDTKSARSPQDINSILQKPLVTPSLFAPVPEYGQPQQPQIPSQPPPIYRDNSNHDNLRSHQLPESHSERHTPNIAPVGVIKEEKELLSTVDISALSAPQQTIPEAVVVTTSSSSSLQNPPNVPAQAQNLVPTAAPTKADETLGVPPSSSSRKSEHHKSEKKKKKDKHKHKEKDKDKDKDKDKSREKRKHKHKDKDKEKDKGIKITIPKDKLNLSTDMTVVSSQQSMANPTVATSQEKKSPPATTGLKIKIPKERLKGNTDPPPPPPPQPQVQGPLKIKIRTSGGNAMGEGSETSVSMSTSSSRKRDRNEATADGNVAPPSKKHHHGQAAAAVTQAGQAQQGNAASSYGQQHQIQQQQQQRQNGRHYSSNNKEKHSSSSHHKSSGKLSQAQQQALLMQQQQQQQQHHHQHSHAT